MMPRYLSMAPWLLLAITSPAYAALDDTSSTGGDRQSLSDAWWTGPLIANSAGALPQGHYLIEPYLYDVRSPHLDSFGSLTYLQYGITDRWMAGLIPTFAYNRVNNGPSSNNIEPGDLSVQAQYSLHSFHEGSPIPAMALMVQETLPTGRYDQLNHPLADAQGSGTYTTTIQLNTQTYFWLPNGRILRMRFNIGGTFSGDASIRDVSIYATPPGFRGHASPGNGFLVNAAWEYSMTQRWVLAFDLAYHYTNGGKVLGTVVSPSGVTPLSYHIGSSASFAFAPAIEYNWSSTLGVIVGVRVFTGGHNSTDTVTPAIALNYVH